MFEFSLLIISQTFLFRLMKIFYRTWGKTRNYNWNNNISRLQIYGVTATEVWLILRKVEKCYEKPQSECLVTEQVFGPGISKISGRSANNSTATCGRLKRKRRYKVDFNHLHNRVIFGNETHNIMNEITSRKMELDGRLL